MAGLAYDPPQHELVLFGGDNASTVFGDTWIRKDRTWAQQHPAQSPPPRTGAAMVYDAATRQLLLFGGSQLISTAGGFYGDTWIWTGHDWSQLHPATSPPARHNAAMIHDAATHNVVLFGGYDGQYLGDTWTWNGTTWTQQDTSTAPAPRDTGSFVYDAATATGILYGGYNGTAALADTWSWNGTTWTQLTPATSPGPVFFAWDAAYDAATQQVLLFGGGIANHTNGAATWEWNGTTWTQLNPATSPQASSLRKAFAAWFDSSSSAITSSPRASRPKNLSRAHSRPFSSCRVGRYCPGSTAAPNRPILLELGLVTMRRSLTQVPLSRARPIVPT